MCEKRRGLLALLIGLAFEPLAGAALTLGPTTQDPAPALKANPGAQQLIDQAIQALGGPAFLSFKTLTTSGRIFAISSEVTAGLDVFESFVLFPDKRRVVLGKDKPVTLINNGDRAWEIDRFGVTGQRPEQIRRWKLSTRYGLENLLRLHARQPGILLQDGGVDFVDNVPARVVDIIEPGGGAAKLYLHRQTSLPVRIDYRARNPHTQDWDEFWDVYGDYQTIQGIKTPMHVARFLNGERISEVFRRTARYDAPYPADYFERNR